MSIVKRICIEKAFRVVAAHLNELSLDAVHETFPGFTYQLGNLFAAVNAVLQAGIAEYYSGNYGLTLTPISGMFLVATVILTAVGKKAKAVQFGIRSLETVHISA
jgi:SHS family lactate transporter-like MFS transporter